MSRSASSEGGWITTFADLMTLLFCFFVLSFYFQISLFLYRSTFHILSFLLFKIVDDFWKIQHKFCPSAESRSTCRKCSSKTKKKSFKKWGILHKKFHFKLMVGVRLFRSATGVRGGERGGAAHKGGQPVGLQIGAPAPIKSYEEISAQKFARARKFHEKSKISFWM